MDSWGKLSMRDRAGYMKLAIDNGIYDLNTIREEYNRFAEGGDTNANTELAKAGVSMLVPFAGTAMDAYDFYKNPTLGNLGWLAASAVADFYTAGQGAKAFRAAKAARAAATIADMRRTDRISSMLNRGNKAWKANMDAARKARISRDALDAEAARQTRKAVATYGANAASDVAQAEINSRAEGGSIHIDPSKKGTFTAAASKHGMGVQEFASKVLAHPENYSPAMRKKANFARNAAKWHGLGGNLFEGGGDRSDKEDSFWYGLGLQMARTFGLNTKYKGSPEDTLYRRNIYNSIDPTSAVPHTAGQVMAYKKHADRAMSGKKLPYKRHTIEPLADAAWAKRLGLDYNKKLLIDNNDGSVRLAKAYEEEIPVDTNFLKQRIASNKAALQYYDKIGARATDKRHVIKTGIEFDEKALDALRHTYKTGEPVSMNEHSHVNRHWLNNGVAEIQVTPLSLLQNYTLQYNKDTGEMEYSDIYDFNELEDFVPGEPFDIKGKIKLNKKKK